MNELYRSETGGYRGEKVLKKITKMFVFAVAVTLLCALGVALSGNAVLGENWRTANRTSASIAPLPDQVEEAVVQVYAARVINWRGLFAVHPWIAVKPRGADAYTVHQVIGWRLEDNLSSVSSREDLPDRHWYGNRPELLVDLRGAEAEAVIEPIRKAIESYPFQDSYSQWPGPNSNTFVAWVGRQVPELRLNLPATAIGKDYIGATNLIDRAPSGTGYQISVFGVLGLLLSLEEGLEVNLLTLNFGINPFKLQAKLPALGMVGADS